MAKTTRKKKRGASKAAALAWLWTPLIVLGCIAALIFTAYLLYLDHRVREQFEGARWSLPAKVYASPLQLYPGETMQLSDLQRELKRLGYVSTSKVERAGSYAIQGKGQLDLVSREFAFWDGMQAPEKLAVHFEGDTIASITDLATGKAVHIARLDPYLIGSLYRVVGEDRILVRLPEVPKLVTAGLISVEDRDFYHHIGIDFEAILRAAIANIRAGHVVQGGSTLTQQLVKNFFLSRKQTYTRKAKEALMAILLETHFSKDEILEAYLNEVYLGQDGARAIHGFGLASRFYFHRPLAELQPQEIALLVAMVRGPSYYNPRRYPKRAKERRNLVLGLFGKANLLSPEQVEAARAAPLGVVDQPPGGTTSYPAFIDLVRRQLLGQYREADLTSEGLRIFTTLDPYTQELAESKLHNGLNTLEKRYGMQHGILQGAVVVTSTEGAEVLAVVGDRNSNYSGFNRALDAHRQIGSLAKPTVYLTALSQPSRYTLVTRISDEPVQLQQPDGSIWEPHNYEHESHGDEVPLYLALAHSYNLATIRLALNVTPKAVADTMHKLGFKGYAPAVPSLALGTVGMAPIQVAQMYNTLATGGYYTPLMAIRSVTSKDGAPLKRYSLKLNRAYDEAPVYLVNWAMQKVVSEGTGRHAYTELSPSLHLAGKTGTTDNLRDSWFAGYSGNRLSVVWVGRDNNKSAHLTGSMGALRIWTQVMAGMEQKPLQLPKPDNVEIIPLNLGNPDHDDEDCDKIMPVPFIQGSLPEDMEPCETSGFQPTQDSNQQPQREEDGGNWFLNLFR